MPHSNRLRMRRAVVLCAWLLVPLGAAGQQEWTPERSFDVKRVGGVALSPDGERVAFTVSSPRMEGEASEWRSHIHIARRDGAEVFQLTSGERSASAPAWSPDGRWIAFLTSRSGRTNVWRIRVDGGEAQQVTDAGADVQAFAWSPDGRRIALTMSDPLTEDEQKARREKRDARVIDEDLKLVGLYVAELGQDGRAGSLRRLSPANVSVGAWSGQAFDWSPDGSAIVYSHKPTPYVNDWPKADLSVVDVASGNVRGLATSAAAESDPHYSPDGRWIAFRGSDEPVTWAFTNDVYVVAAQGGQPRKLAETVDRGPGIAGWRGDGSAVLVTETQGTVNRLLALPLDGGVPRDLSPAGMMVGGASLNRGGTHIAFVSEAPDRAPEVFTTPLARFTPVQVSRVQSVTGESLGRTEVVRWRSSDGVDVEGLLTLPPGHTEGTRVPLLVIVHGGPTGVHTQGFIGGASQYPIAVFAARGYAVLRPNPRGSSGYGRDFRYANYNDWGGGDYGDIMAGVDAMVQRGVADAQRLGVMGWSYGGFMTSWIVTQTDRFRAASIGAALPNLMSFAGTSDVPDFIPDYFGGDYWDRKEQWEAHSPLFQVKNARTPSLIQHGEVDDRVPVSQGYEFYNALKRLGVPARLVIYPRTPHGFREPKLLRDAMDRNLEWFDRWLRGVAATSDR